MVESCPVCETTVPASEEHCSKCGFPTALVHRLGAPLSEVPVGPEDEPLPPAPPVRSARAAREAGPEADVNASLARALEQRTELLLTIDRDAPDVTGELCEAALGEASGRVAEAQQVLRSAQGRVDRETEELLGRHLENLEARGRALEAAGLRLALDEELGHVAETIVGGDTASGVAALAEAERRMDGLETHWQGLQTLIAQVTSLREEAGRLGIALDNLPDRLPALRTDLAAMPATERDLEAATQVAAEALMRLHEAIPPALEEELQRHAKTLDAHPVRASRAQVARRRHTEAVDHLKGGRLEDAVRSVRELRAALEELAYPSEEVAAEPEPGAPAPPGRPTPVVTLSAEVPKASASPGGGVPSPSAAPAVPPAPVAAPPAGRAPPDPAVVETLMKKVRSLAVRVRALPVDSPEAAAAARQIHEATELLRTRRYTEADAALSRLMRSLDDAGSRT